VKKHYIDHHYRDALINAQEDDTVYSQLFNIGWENSPHRTIRNSTVIQWQKAHCPPSGKRPNENEIIATNRKGENIVRYSDTIPVKGMEGNLEALALYAGQGVGLMNKVQPAKLIMSELVKEAIATIQGQTKRYTV